MANEMKDAIEEFIFLDYETLEYIKENTKTFSFLTITIIMFSLSLIALSFYCFYIYPGDIDYKLVFLQCTMVLLLGVFVKRLSYKEVKRILDIETFSKRFIEPDYIKESLCYSYHKEKRREYNALGHVVLGIALLMYGVVLVKFFINL